MTIGDDKKCSEIREKIRDNFAKLTKSFPMDGLVAELYSKKVINDEEKEQLREKRLRKEKVSFLFEEVINQELHAGDSTKFDSLIKVMEASDDNTAKHLAKLLR